MSIDYMVRKAAAKWSREVSIEAPSVPGRMALAKALLESIAPATPIADSVLVHCVFLVRVVVPNEHDATQSEVNAVFEQVADVLVTLGAFV